MPRFDTTYSDEEIAAIASYVHQAWDNEAEPVSPEQGRRSPRAVPDDDTDA